MSSCIEWHGCRSHGYGQRKWQGKNRQAHRVAYVEAHGLDIEDIAGQVVRHKCDNPGCVNPEHLELGTHMDNMKDRDERGRGGGPRRRGEANGRSRITEEQAAEILSRYVPYCRSNGTCALAREFGVGPSTISHIVKGRTWKLINEKGAA